MVDDALSGEEPVPGGITGKIESEMELLRRHVEILKTVRDEGPIGIIRLSELTGHAQHKVRYSLRVLEQEDLIEPSTQGAKATAEVDAFLERLRGLLNTLTETVSEIRKAID